MINITDAKKSKIKEDGILLLDFYADWCMPCRILLKNLKGLESSIKDDKIKIGKVNIDDNPILEEEYSIGSIPCLVLIKNGEEIARDTGCKSGKAVRKFIIEKLNSNL